MLCTGPYWKGFGGRGLAGWIIVAGGQVLSCASHLLPSAPNTTAINPPCAKISTREAHGASAHRYLRKQQLLRGQNSGTVGMWLETYSWKEGPCARASTALKGLWVMGCTPSRDTVEGLCPAINPRWGGGRQVRSKKQQTPPQSPALPLTSPKGLGVSEHNVANSGWVKTCKQGKVFYWIRAWGRKVFLCQLFCLSFFSSIHRSVIKTFVNWQ